MESFLKDKWSLILGASSGFGGATAQRLAESGSNIIGVHFDRKGTMPKVEEIKENISKHGNKVVFFNVNAASSEKRADTLKQIREICGEKSIQVFMHSLAFGNLKNFIEDDSKNQITQAQMEMTLDVMAHSLVYWVQDTFHQNLFSPGASVYAMTSAGSSRVWRGYGAVSAAKSSLESHCRQLGLELAPHNIAVNAILAGVTDTPALRKIPGHESMIETASKKNPFGRLTTPDDVAKAITLLSHPYAEFMTGNTLYVDGGENIVE